MTNLLDHKAALMALVNAILSLVISFGLDLSSEQVGAILALSSAFLAAYAVSRGKAVKDLEPTDIPVGD